MVGHPAYLNRPCPPSDGRLGVWLAAGGGGGVEGRLGGGPSAAAPGCWVRVQVRAGAGKGQGCA